jgi:hypothetical protein
MKKYLLILLSLLVLPTITWASQINMSVDKTEISTNDVLEIRLSVDGVLDDGQIGIQGLENFNIVGQSSSQQVQIINGQTTAVQEKILTLQPNQNGEFVIQAIGKEGGKEIKSSAITIKVNKSLVQETKEKLLSSVSSSEDKTENSAKKSDKIKNLLTQPTKTSVKPTTEQLQIKKLPEMPSVQHFSAFNKIFWLEFFSVLVLLGVIFRGIWYFKQKNLK